MNEFKGTITRRMDAVVDDFRSAFKFLYTEKNFKDQLNKYKKLKADNRSDWPSELQKLRYMFGNCGIDYEEKEEADYYEKLIEDSVKNHKIAIDEFDVEGRMVYALYQNYDKYSMPKDYMERLVNRLCHKEDNWGDDTLRVRILKQFIKYGNCLSDKGYNKYSGQEYIKNYLNKKLNSANIKKKDIVRYLDDIGDDIFDVLKSAEKLDSYAILKLADDLAEGKFRTEGATKKGLYLFAMVYGMTFYSGDAYSDRLYSYGTDIEKNLFQDYYVNNLTRYLSEEFRDHKAKYEIDPSGQGINYKNFAEIIYLYYIASDYTPQEKIKKSSDMISKIKKRAYGDLETQDTHSDTKIYRDNYIQDILKMKEDEFEDFVYHNYDCNVKKSGTAVSPIQLQTEQNTAYEEYCKLIEKIKDFQKSYKSRDDEEHKLDYEFYGLWLLHIKKETETQNQAYENIKAMLMKYTDGIVPNDQKPNDQKIREFVELLRGADGFMREKTLSVESASQVTRTSIIVAFYYYINAKLEFAGESDFKDVWEIYRDELGEILEKSYLQPLSSKNIFDVIVVVSSYMYLNN